MGLISFKIEGIEYIDSITDTGGPIELEFGLNESIAVMQVSTPNEFALEGEGYDYLKSIFFTPTNGPERSLKTQIQLDCCNQSIDLLIEFNGVRFCEFAGTVHVRLTESSPDLDAHDCLDVPFFREGFLENVPMPKILYLVNSGLIPGAIGIRWHYAPYIRDIFEYHCNRCADELGIDFAFESTIFQDQVYKNAVMFQCLEIGFDLDDLQANPTPKEDNYLTWTVLQLTDELQPVMNTEKRIRDGKFILERRDVFNTNRPTFFDLNEAYENGELREPEDICFEGSQFENYAYFEGAARQDNIDTYSKRVMGQYKDIVEWNPSGLTSRRKVKVAQHNFSPPAYNKDFQLKYTPGFLGPIPQGMEDCVLLTETEPIENPKIIVLDGTTAGGFHKPVRRQLVGLDRFIYNMPMSFVENLPEPELYQNFWFVDSPDFDNRLFKIDKINYLPSDVCATLSMLINNGTDVKITTEKGEAYPDKIKYIDGEGLFELSNLVVSVV